MSRSTDTNARAGIFESFYASMSQRLSNRLFEQVCRAESLRPGWSMSKALAFLCAGLVHLVVAGLAFAGIWMLITGGPKFSALFGAAVCFALAWSLAPRLPSIKEQVLRRSELPAMFRLTDRVAGVLGARPIEGIVIDWRFNAAYASVGWRRRRLLCLGLPLFYALGGQERVALLSHELAHAVNGDPARGFFIGSAVTTLERWHSILQPDGLMRAESGYYGLIGLIVNLASLLSIWILRLIALIPRFAALVMVHLYWSDSQRAEYFADHRATTVSGTDAFLRLLMILERGDDVMWSIVQKAALGGKVADLFEELSRQLAESSRNIEKQIREGHQKARIDSTHPPSELRMAFLRARSVAGAKLVISPSDWDAIDRELEPFKREIQDKLEDKYRGSLYY